MITFSNLITSELQKKVSTDEENMKLIIGELPEPAQKKQEQEEEEKEDENEDEDEDEEDAPTLDTQLSPQSQQPETSTSQQTDQQTQHEQEQQKPTEQQQLPKKRQFESNEVRNSVKERSLSALKPTVNLVKAIHSLNVGENECNILIDLALQEDPGLIFVYTAFGSRKETFHRHALNLVLTKSPHFVTY